MDKLTVATLLTLKILVNEGKLESTEVDFLINGSAAAVDPGNMGPLQEWMPDSIWRKVKALEVMPRFKGIGDSMQSDSDDWGSYFDIEKVEDAEIPGEFKAKLNALDKLMLLRAIRPDRLINSLSSFVGDAMGKEYVTQKPFNMAETFEETSKRTPVFFVLFAGVDPTPWVESLGKEKGISTENKRSLTLVWVRVRKHPQKQLSRDLLKRVDGSCYRIVT